MITLLFSTIFLVNADCPKDVTIEAEPSLVLIENKTLTLRCTAQSHPPLTSVTWEKMANGKRETWKTPSFSLKSVSPSDSGLYRCKASNDIGTGDSEQVEVIVECEYTDALMDEDLIL